MPRIQGIEVRRPDHFRPLQRISCLFEQELGWAYRYPRRSSALVLCALVLSGIARDYATLVFGSLQIDPDPPRPGVPFTLTLVMSDATRVPVEDAVVFAELHAPAGGDPVVVELAETPIRGTYSAHLTLAEASSYHLIMRDRTFRREEARASLQLEVGGGEAVGSLSFIFPPTASEPRSLTTWLLWLIGLPMAAGLLVSFLVLANTRRPSASEKRDPPS